MKRKENDYLPCKEYLADGIEDNDGFVLFQNSKTKLYYFVLKNKKGRIKLKSEGYPSAEIRETGLSSVKLNLKKLENYEIIEKDKKFLVILYANNNQEIARSCRFDNRREFEDTYQEFIKPARIPKWFWFALPFLIGSVFLLGEKYSNSAIINNYYKSIDKYSEFENSFSRTVLYFEPNTPTKQQVIQKTCFTDITKNYLNNECYYLYLNKNNREEFKEHLAKVRYGNAVLYENIKNLGNFVKINKMDSLHLIVKTYQNNSITVADSTEINARQLAVLRNSIEKIIPSNVHSKLIIKEIASGNYYKNDAKTDTCQNGLESSICRRIEITGVKFFRGKDNESASTLVKSDTTYLKKGVLSRFFRFWT